jgi:malate dehydrogenase (oxaloacetate-decarboxylating)
MLDCTYRLQTPHRSGQLARVASVIAEAGGLIGDVVTIAVTRESSIREITVEVRDTQTAERIAQLLGAVEGARVLWYRDRAFIRHEGGKLVMDVVRPVRTLQDVRDVYTPGVARVSLAIAADPALARRYTMIGRSVGIFTNGTRVLGLGDIGAQAAMPVMEGKAIFYRQCVDISAVPILVDTRDPDEFVATVARVAPTFGAIHLEDISAPACFAIEARLKQLLAQPVMHDDVHGTAVVTLAAVLVAARQTGVSLGAAVVGQLGLGAAGFGIASLMVDAGARRVVAFDPNAAAHARAREHGIVVGALEDVMGEADIVVATTGRPGLITPAMVRPGQVILALTNPDPEITPATALAAGAAFAADGSMVNNVLGYPGIFRGALDVGARKINLPMKLAAAEAIAAVTADSELVPDALDRGVHERVASAVRAAALASGVATIPPAAGAEPL